MWLAWTGVETKPVDSRTDEGVWNIADDKYSELKIRKD